ncbi:MAG: hypothetical protein AAF569_09470 [Pseudomonadota bacterium]
MRRAATNFLFFVLGVLTSIVILSASAYSNNANIFFESLYDVPVMPGLVEIDDYALSFDAPQGRVAEAAALVDSGVQITEIMNFYMKSLPQLGWAGNSQNTYIREDERLTISAEVHNGKNVVLFLLEPR